MASSKTSMGVNPWEVHDQDLSDENTSAMSSEQQASIDDSLGLQMISIRLQRSLLQNLKAIADYHNIGYQPLIRDLLNRFAKSELQSILQERLAQIELDMEKEAPMDAVDSFLAREGERKRA